MSATPSPPPAPPAAEQASIELEVCLASYNPTTVVTTPVKDKQSSPRLPARMLSSVRVFLALHLSRILPIMTDYLVSNILLLPLLILPSPFFMRNVHFFGLPRLARVMFCFINLHLLFVTFAHSVLFILSGRAGLHSRGWLNVVWGVAMPLYMLTALARHFYNLHALVFSGSTSISSQSVLISLLFLVPCYLFPHLYRLLYRFQCKQDTRNEHVICAELITATQKAHDQTAFSNVDDEAKFVSNLAHLRCKDTKWFGDYPRENVSSNLERIVTRLQSFDQSGVILTRLPIGFTFYAQAARVLFILVNYWHGLRGVHYFWSSSPEEMLGLLTHALPGQPWNLFLAVAIILVSLRFICQLFSMFEPLSRADVQSKPLARTLSMTLKHPLFTLVFLESSYGVLVHLHQLVNSASTWHQHWQHNLGVIFSLALLVVVALLSGRYAYSFVLFLIVSPLDEPSLKILLTKLGKLWNSRNASDSIGDDQQQQQQQQVKIQSSQWCETQTLSLIQDWYTTVAVYHFVQRFSKQFKQDFLLNFFTTGQVFETK